MSPKFSRYDASGAEIGKDYQQACHDSWRAVGDVISVNPSDEVALLSEQYGEVRFVPSARDARGQFGRPLVFVDDVLHILRASEAKIVGIVNSDVYFRGSPEDVKALLQAAERGIVMVNRSESDTPGAQGGWVYRYGFDAFFFHRDKIQDFDMTGFALGAPWWDYWLGLNAALSGVTTFVVKRRLCSHLTHAQRWDLDAWRRMFDLTLDKLRKRINEEIAELDRAGARASGLHALANFVRFLHLQSHPSRSTGYSADSLYEPLGITFGLFAVQYIEQSGFLLSD